MKQSLTLLLRIVLATALTIGTHFVIFVACWAFRDQLGTGIAYAARQLVFASAAVAPEARAFDSLNDALSTSILFSSPSVPTSVRHLTTQ
jgi:hypothetical protein